MVDGRIIAGKFVKLAAQRHLDDLQNAVKRGLVFDAKAAEYVIGFFPTMLQITAGPYEGKPFHLLPWQLFVVGSLFGWKRKSGRLRFRKAWLEAGKGSAKALALDTPIPTPDGWKTMGELKTGDRVFNENGKPREVTYAHEVLYDQKCYRVSFNDGSSIVCDAGHLWRTEIGNSGDIDIRTTQEIASTLLLDHSIPDSLADQDRKIVAVEPVSSVPVKCISVSGASSMYLCGKTLIPTHNSPLLAGLGLYMMAFHGVNRAEVYAIGETLAAARVLFRDAVSMSLAQIPGSDPQDSLVNRGIIKTRGTGDQIWELENIASGSVFKPIPNSDAASGPRPTLVCADEVHEYKKADPVEIWQRAITKMSTDALLIMATNTPASTQLVGTYYSDVFQKVLTGEIIDDEAFAYIARVDKEDWEDVFDNPDCWEKALPALGLTFPVENLDGEVHTARKLISTAQSVKRLYFGIPTGTVDYWIDENAWEAAQGCIDEQKLVGLPCWLSLDLSQKNDLTALTACWQDEKGYLYAKTWYYTSESGLDYRENSDNAPYSRWVEEGFLTAVPGATIDRAWVAEKVREIVADHKVIGLAFDPSGIATFIDACHEIGVETWKYEGKDSRPGRGLMIVSHAQGTRVVFNDKQLCMPHSVVALEDAVLKEKITIDSNPVTTACAGNAAVVSDAQKNRAFDKKRSRGRIDGIVTLAMAVGAQVANFEPKKRKIEGSLVVI